MRVIVGKSSTVFGSTRLKEKLLAFQSYRKNWDSHSRQFLSVMINSIQRDQICSCKSLIKWSILIKLIKISSLYFIQYLIAKQWGNIEALFLLIFTRSHFEKFGSIEVSGYASLLKPLGKWNTFQFVICCGSKNTEQQIIVFTVPAYWQLSRRLKYKKAGFYWGDHSKLTSLPEPEFRLSMLFSLFSIFIAVIIFLKFEAQQSHSSSVLYTENGSYNPSRTGTATINNAGKTLVHWTTSWNLWRDSWRSLQTRKWAN